MPAPLILIVDDEDFNRDILGHYLQEEGYETIDAADGDIALEKLASHPHVDAIILDRMMPRMNGMEVMKKIKSNPDWSHIPVIMQTAAALSTQVQEGVQAGVYYYLTKPYSEALLLSLVRAALKDHHLHQEMLEEAERQRHIIGLLEEARFHFRTPEEAKNLSYFSSHCFPDPETAIYGLTELMINAIEHGNLGITFAEKSALLLNNQWEGMITTRLNQQPFSSRHAELLLISTDEYVEATITDSGDGFDWKNYLNITPERLTAPNGRGILTATSAENVSVTFEGKGNIVRYRMKL